MSILKSGHLQISLYASWSVGTLVRELFLQTMKGQVMLSFN